MIIKSCGILVHRTNEDKQLEVFLIRANTPNFMSLWGVPKGRVEKGEKALQTAKREFFEEVGTVAPEGVEYLPLKPFRTNYGKTIIVFTGDVSGHSILWNADNIKAVPVWTQGEEVVKKETRDGRWFTLEEAYIRIGRGQRGILDNFIEHLDNRKNRVV
jgi:predicted NUDIX family NTP pyrophosphohydrolase